MVSRCDVGGDRRRRGARLCHGLWGCVWVNQFTLENACGWVICRVGCVWGLALALDQCPDPQDAVQQQGREMWVSRLVEVHCLLQ